MSKFEEIIKTKKLTLKEVLDAAKDEDFDVFSAQASVNGETYFSAYQVIKILENLLEK